VDDATVNVITAELLKEHREALPDGDDQYWELQRMLGLLPDVDEWAVAKRVPEIFAISPGNTVFTVRVSAGESVSVESRPLDGHKLIVGMESKVISATQTQRVRETSWTFRYVAGAEGASRDEWRDITGTLYMGRDGNEDLDQREKFARAIASRAGWPAVVSGPAD
jgi:hypothetical protein